MQLVSFNHTSGLRLGLKTPAGVVDLTLAAAESGRPELPASLSALCAGGASAHAALAALAAPGRVPPAWLLPEPSLKLAPCVPNPGKIICVGLNYQRHALESNMAIPEFPVLFSKFSNTLAASGDTVPVPNDATEMDYEAELAIVIGARCHGVSPAEALSCVLGYCNANDLSARDLQFRTGQWLLGKSCAAFCPLGPYLVTADAVPDPDSLPIRCWVNGELRQDSNTRDMIFSCRDLISYISRYFTLEPGDVILTGTPDGVAFGRPDRPWLQPGDQVTVEVAGLGLLANRIGSRTE